MAAVTIVNLTNQLLMKPLVNQLQRFRLSLLLMLPGIFITTLACGQNRTVQTSAGVVVIENLASGLTHPWGMAFLPDGRLLVTERSGQLRILDQDNTLSQPLVGVPEVFNEGQGGLLDVALHPNFEQNSLVYLSFSEPGEDGTASTALGLGKLNGQQLEDFSVIFSQEPKVEGPNHFGGRVEFTENGQLFLTLGERFKFEPAQELGNHLGTIVRLNLDGSIPEDNPFVNQAEAEDEIWSYGHRNIEAAAIDPATGNLWVAEMGPLGGDEFNQPVAGNNYGWPVVSWGKNYDGSNIPDPPAHPRFANAAIHWTPVISPSGMTFYTGNTFTEWQGHAMIGGLTASGVVVVNVKGEQAEEVARIPLGARIRDVVEAPDGAVYVLTDLQDGNIWKLYKQE